MDAHNGLGVHVLFLDAHKALVFKYNSWMLIGRALVFTCYSRVHIGPWCSNVIHGCS